MILKNFDVAKASRIGQISAKFLKGGVPVIATHLTNSYPSNSSSN